MRFQVLLGELLGLRRLQDSCSVTVDRICSVLRVTQIHDIEVEGLTCEELLEHRDQMLLGRVVWWEVKAFS